MARPTTNLDRYNDDRTDMDLMMHGIYLQNDGSVRIIFYAWLSEERKKQNHESRYWKYCPFIEGEKVSKTYRGMKLVGKIKMLDCTYYEGDCLVLYVDLDKRSSKKWLASKKED